MPGFLRGREGFEGSSIFQLDFPGILCVERGSCTDEWL